MRIAVVGLGKVGIGLAACLRHAGHDVLGIDESAARVQAIEQRRIELEPGVGERLWPSETDRREAGGSGTFRATTAYADVAETALAFIVVPTPSEPGGGFSLQHVLSACERTGGAFRGVAGDRVVALVSTVLPGASREAIVPALETACGRAIGDGLHYAYNPAFVALGEVVDGFERPDVVLIGQATPHAGDLLEQVHRSMLRRDSAIVRLTPAEVEIAKLASNTHDACRVAFANMLLTACTQFHDADVDRVSGALAHRFGGRFLRGAVPFGGPCWPRDNVALASVLDAAGLPSTLPRAVTQMNLEHARYLLDIVLRRSDPGACVAVVGLSYKPGTPLIDESFGVRLAGWLSEARREVLVWDALALGEARRVLGDAVRYARSAADCAEQASVVVLVHPLREPVDWRRATHLTVIDCWRSLSQADAAQVQHYLPLGRGPAGRPGPRVPQQPALDLMSAP